MQEEKTKHREGKEYRDLVNRLSRIEGQVRGVKKMVEEDRCCTISLFRYTGDSRRLERV